MSNKLKNFVSEHRREFDDELPPATMWNDIEQALQKKPASRLSIGSVNRWMTAAVFFISVTCIYLLVTQREKKDDAIAKIKAAGTSQNPGAEIKKLAPEFAAEAQAIFQSIETRQQELKVIAKEQPALYAQFAEDLSALDSSYRVLRQKATQTPNREVILRAMLQNLQLQAELLAKQLEILNDIKPSKQPNNEENYLPGT